MKTIVKYCLLSVLLMSFSSVGFALDEKREECPKGQVFDKEKGACVIREVTPAVEVKDSTVPSDVKVDRDVKVETGVDVIK